MYRINTLLKQDQKLFHTQDLALLWGITNNNTLYTTIKRLIQKDVFIPIHKGFYSTVPLKMVDPIRLGLGYLHSFSYVSTETILIQQGIIFQKSEYITLISSKSTKFEINRVRYLSRKLKDVYLFNKAGLEMRDSIYFASKERAIADILYFNPSYFFDMQNTINWREVIKIQKEIGYI